MNDAQVENDSLVISVFDHPTTLDPHRAYETTDRHPVLNMYDSLLSMDLLGNVYPTLLAVVPEIVERGGEWIIPLAIRNDVKFHDGSILTTDDVVYSLRRGFMTDPDQGSLWSDALLGTICTEISAADAREMAERVQPTSEGLTLILPQPYAPILTLLVQWSLVVGRSWCATRGEWDGSLDSIGEHLHPTCTALDTTVNGTGPYSLASWDRGSNNMVFKYDPDHWGVPPDARVVTLTSDDDRTSRESELLTGSSDFSVCQPESRDRLGEMGAVVLEELPDEWCITPLGFITQRLDPMCDAVGDGEFGPHGLPPDALADVHLRRAIVHSFDRERYVKEVLDGSSLQHQFPFPAGVTPYDPQLQAEFDLTMASEQLSLACDGLASSKGFKFVIHTHQANISRTMAAEILRDGLSALSSKIHIEIIEMDLATLTDAVMASQAPLAWMGWAGDYRHPYAFVSGLVDPRSRVGAALGIQSQHLIELSNQARESSGSDAERIYRELAQHVYSEALYLCPPGKVSYMTYKSRWTGVQLKNQVPNVLDFRSFKLRHGETMT